MGNFSTIHHLMEGMFHKESEPVVGRIRINDEKIREKHFSSVSEFAHNEKELPEVKNLSKTPEIPPVLEKMGVSDTSKIDYVDHNKISLEQLNEDKIIYQNLQGSPDNSATWLAGIKNYILRQKGITLTQNKGNIVREMKKVA